MWCQTTSEVEFYILSKNTLHSALWVWALPCNSIVRYVAIIGNPIIYISNDFLIFTYQYLLVIESKQLTV